MPIMAVDLSIGLKNFCKTRGNIAREINNAALLNIGLLGIVSEMMIETRIGRTEVAQRIPPRWVLTPAPIDPMPQLMVIDVSKRGRKRLQPVKIGA